VSAELGAVPKESPEAKKKYPTSLLSPPLSLRWMTCSTQHALEAKARGFSRLAASSLGAGRIISEVSTFLLSSMMISPQTHRGSPWDLMTTLEVGVLSVTETRHDALHCHRPDMDTSTRVPVGLAIRVDCGLMFVLSQFRQELMYAGKVPKQASGAEHHS